MNPTLFIEVTGRDVVWSFVQGLRFDLSTIAMANGILFLGLVIFDGKEWFRKWPARIYFTFANGIFLGLNILDSEFYKFNGKRLTRDYLQNAGDIQRHSLSVFLSYWWLFILFVISLIALYFLFPKLLKLQNHASLSIPRKTVMSLGVIAFTVIVVRGGLQFKPISLVNAYTQGDQGLGALVLNTPFTFVKGHGTGLSEAPVFIKDLREAKRNIREFRGSDPDFQPIQDIENVVVIVIESLSLEYTGLMPGQPSYTPFIDHLTEKALVFTNNYANGRRSIEAMPSIFCGIPSLVTAPLITSSLSQNELHCLPEYFGKAGFETAFFHGAHNGSFRMDSFSTKAGFKRFYGLNEYPDPQDSDGHWGILDEPMFRFMAREISTYKPPFLAGIFTLSSHHPYFIPEPLRDQFKEGPLPIHKSIGYADYALKSFFEEASSKPWFKKTLFVITADHTQKNHEKSYQFFSGEYRVPLIIYSESPDFKRRFLARKRSLKEKVTQAVDIPATVMAVMGLEARPSLPPFGANVLSEKIRGLAVNFDGYQYWLRAGNTLIALDQKGSLTEDLRLHPNGFLKEKKSGGGEDELDAELLLLKSIVSVFNREMRQNSLYRPD